MRPHFRKVRPFGMPRTPFDPMTGKYFPLSPEEEVGSGGGSRPDVDVNEVPDGGTDGQVLTKNESGYGWEDSEGLPDGGTDGQVLTKNESGYGWEDSEGLPDGGTEGQVLTKEAEGHGWADLPEPTVDEGVTDGQYLKWNATTEKWEPQDVVQITVITGWKLDKAGHKFQVKTQEIDILAAEAESDWTDVPDADGGVLDEGVVPDE